MSRQRLHISIALMVMAILAVSIFQWYWLYKNYRDEEAALTLRTNFLFRDAVLQCQAYQMQSDSSENTHFKIRSETAGIVNVLRDKFFLRSDSIPGLKSEKTTVMISVDDNHRNNRNPSRELIDSISQVAIAKSPGRVGWIQILKQVDSLQDSIRVSDIQEKYAAALKNANIPVSFRIDRSIADSLQNEFEIQDADNAVTVGFNKPITFSLSLYNSTPYLVGKLKSRILVSLLLVGLTILSFVVLLRNLVRQRRLTQMKNELISNITHELKTPIATVSVAIEALKSFNAMQDPEKTKEYLNISGNEMQRLSLLVDKVLKLSMFENRQMTFKRENFDLQLLLEEILGAMKLQFEKCNATATLSSKPGSFIMQGDRLHIASVFYNLLDNALKYGNSSPTIHISLQQTTQGGLLVRVCDDGIGIPTEYRKRVFEKFFRVPNGDRHNTHGYGLGLSYVAEVVNAHQGSIWADSGENGRGSCFILNFPASTAAQAAAGTGSAASAPEINPSAFGKPAEG